MLVLLAAGALALAGIASGKGGARARLVTPLPLNAPPGTTIRVGWTVHVPNGRGGWQPFGASGMFLRLLSKTGAASTVGVVGGSGQYPALAGTLRAFVRAYDDGDIAALDRLFSRQRFAWYSSGGPGRRLRDQATDRGTLLAYFRGRHRRGDRLARLSFRLNSSGPQLSLGDFELDLQRRAADFRGGRWFAVTGKGALDCSKRPVTIGALSIGAPEP